MEPYPDIGGQNQGAFEANLNGLDSGKTYFYHFETSNGQLLGQMPAAFIRFDQGILRIILVTTNMVPMRVSFGTATMVRRNKVVDNMSIYTYLAPNGSSWRMAKAKFQLSENLLFGENLEDIRLTELMHFHLKSMETLPWRRT